jgi:simple sugar transport system permease protein
MTATETLSAPEPLADPWSARLASLLPKNRTRRTLLYIGIGLVIVSIVRSVSNNSDDLTASGTYRSALTLAVPILLAGLGGLFAERVGVVNIGLEGMMILGTFGAGWAGWKYGPWMGILVGIAFGALGGLLHALATVTFGVDHVISGVAINLIAPGVVRFLADTAFTGQPGGAISQGPAVKGNTGKIGLPFLSGGKLFGWKSPDALVDLERKHWFLVSDAAGIVHGLTSDLAWLTVFVIILLPVLTYILWRTPFGLRLRSIGEKPEAADSLGVPVYRMKYIGLAISGGLAGLGGAFLVIETGASRYNEGQTGNRGFIGLAALIFGNWRPGGVAMGAGVFGFSEALRLRSADSVRAVLLLAVIGLVVAAIWAILQRRLVTAVLSVAFGAFFLVYYFITDKVPTEFQFMLPYLTTLIVLVIASKRLRPPAAVGKRWRKGETT